MVGEPVLAGLVVVSTGAYACRVVAGDEDVVDAVTSAAPAVPAVLAAVGLGETVGVGQPGAGEGPVEAVLPVAEHGQVRDVAWFDDIEVARDDDWAGEGGKESRHGVGDRSLEGALVLVAPLLWSPVGQDIDAAGDPGEVRRAGSQDGSVVSAGGLRREHGGVAVVCQGAEEGV